MADYDPIAPEDTGIQSRRRHGAVWLFDSAAATADASQKIPLIVYIYGGPAGQIVQDAWGGANGLFHQILAKEGFAIFSVDNRGTPNRGKKFSAAIRLQSAPVELKDQLTALDQLYAQFPQLDRTRTGDLGMVERRLL